MGEDEERERLFSEQYSEGRKEGYWWEEEEEKEEEKRGGGGKQPSHND